MIDNRDLKRLINEYGKLSIGQLEMLTKESREDLNIAVQYWLNRGKIEVTAEEKPSCSGGCSGCSITSSCDTVYYQWVTA